MLAFLTILFMLIVAYSFWGEGVHTAFCMLVNVIVAGLVAFTFFEPLADFLEPTFSNTFLEGYEDFLSLMVIFAAVLGGLRFATNYLVSSVIDYHPMLRQLGAAACGLVAGYFLAGFLVCAYQTLPWYVNFMGFDEKYDSNAPNAKVRALLPPDRVWLAFMQRASQVPLSSDPPEMFDMYGSFEARYARYRRYTDQREQMTYWKELKPDNRR